MRNILVRSVIVGLVLGVVAGWAQTSQISGTIKDPSGSAIPGAAIKATQTATGVVRNATSGADGGYVLPDLPIGPYQLEVTKEGFSRYVQTGIVLQVDSNPTVDVSMQVGAVSEQVTVEASAAQVETRSTAIGSVVNNQQVAEMPLNGRDPHELIFLAGMANYPGAGSFNSVRNYPTVVVSVAGGNGDTVAYLLDGVMWQDPYNSLSLPLAVPGRSAGIQGGDQRGAGAVWVPRGRDGQCRHQIRHQRISRRSVRIPAERRFERPRLLRHRARYSEAKSVRRRCRRARSASFQEQALFLRRLAENFAALGRHPEHRLYSHARIARRRLHRACFAGVQQRRAKHASPQLSGSSTT